MKVHIKNMVSNRCKMRVTEEFKKNNINFSAVKLGEVDLQEAITKNQREQLKTNLSQFGFELLDNKQAILVETTKNIIIKMVWNSDEMLKTNFSTFLSKKLNHNYTYLANLFSEIQGISIQQFIILNKIERIKELITYDELNITEIAYEMNYSSVSHLSNQFKKNTGMSPAQFKQATNKIRTPIDEIGNAIPSKKTKAKNKSKAAYFTNSKSREPLVYVRKVDIHQPIFSRSQ